MLLNKISRMSLLVATCLLVLSAGNLNARGPGDDNGYSRYLRPLVTAIDYHTRMIYLFNYENEKLIIVDPASIAGWPGDIPLQHTAVLPGANRIYISSDNTQEHPAYVIALKIEDINWRTGSASLTLDELIVMDSPDMPAELPFVETVEGQCPKRSRLAVSRLNPGIRPDTAALFSLYVLDRIHVGQSARC